MNIRKEENKDHKEVFDLIKNAFENEEYSDHKEQFLVERLRNSDSFVPELSLVAEIDGQIVGYILMTKIKIVNDNLQKTISLALAPVAVLKKYQGKGIGGKLIRKAHQKAKELEFSSVILLGHEKYYPRFGYKMTKNYEIKLPFEVPDENCMLIELTEDALKDVKGIVEYPKEFYE
ncbi:acetyltransferase [compost metagenome]